MDWRRPRRGRAWLQCGVAELFGKGRMVVPNEIGHEPEKPTLKLKGRDNVGFWPRWPVSHGPRRTGC